MQTKSKEVASNKVANNQKDSEVQELTPQQQLEALKQELAAKKQELKKAQELAKKDKKVKFTRGHALVYTLAKHATGTGITKDQINELCDKYFSQYGGKSSLSGAQSMSNIHLSVFIVAGVLTYNKDTKTYIWQGKPVDQLTEVKEVLNQLQEVKND